MTKQAPLAGPTLSCMGCGSTFKSLDYTVKGRPGYCKACGHLLSIPTTATITVVETVLEEANRLIYGERKEQYGNAQKNFSDIATLWEFILGVPVTAEQVALCMIQLKVVRAMNDVRADRQIKRDTVVDLAGYAGIIAKIQDGD